MKESQHIYLERHSRALQIRQRYVFNATSQNSEDKRATCLQKRQKKREVSPLIKKRNVFGRHLFAINSTIDWSLTFGTFFAKSGGKFDEIGIPSTLSDNF
ncbi:hypothetical protein TNIN_58431 [Trichonephila inaurata madagascariensis]|uniref:Uncharacterized protein n=1 Tax=Trichonephila inaurata madagascariensis TaxID=2747483 RepID=A0A8X6X876_9ARAC|nr:hypothetical protein TNIN_58431 [Trichonephila inaurata madagascariensis]